MLFFFNDIISIENFDAHNIKIDENSYNILFTILDMWQSKRPKIL